MSEGCYRVPLSEYPGMNRFVLDWLAGKTDAFLPHGARPSRPSRTAGPGVSPGDQLRDALIESNRNWGLNVTDEVTRWASGDSFTIVAGQQVNFAGGPLYTLAKLISVVKMKRDAEKQGRKVTLFFWLASEDHDFTEAANLAIPKSLVDAGRHQRDLIYIQAKQSGESRHAVGPLRVPQALIDELLAIIPMDRPRWLRDGVTFRDSFAELIADVLGSEKIVLVDSLLPELRRAGAPLFEAIGSRWRDLQHEISSRSAALTNAGYQPQVIPREGEEYTLLYELDQHENRNLLHAGKPLPNPESISTSALTRPLLQDFVFNADVFVGGPAEVSYYAQIAPLYEMLNVSRPRVALRGHVLVAPKRVVKLMSRFSIEPRDVFRSPDEILTSGHSEDIKRVKELAASAEKNLLEHIEKIADIALPADHALARSINRSIGHLEYHFRKLTERAIRGLVRKDRERYAAVKELVATFYPDQHVQDRVAAWFPFWHRFGSHLVDRMVDEIEPDTSSFKIIGL